MTILQFATAFDTLISTRKPDFCYLVVILTRLVEKKVPFADFQDLPSLQTKRQSALYFAIYCQLLVVKL